MRTTTERVLRKDYARWRGDAARSLLAHRQRAWFLTHCRITSACAGPHRLSLMQHCGPVPCWNRPASISQPNQDVRKLFYTHRERLRAGRQFLPGIAGDFVILHLYRWPCAQKAGGHILLALNMGAAHIAARARISFRFPKADNDGFPGLTVDEQTGAVPTFLRFGEREHLVVPDLDEVVDFVGGTGTRSIRTCMALPPLLESQRQLKTNRSPETRRWQGVWVKKRDVWR